MSKTSASVSISAERLTSTPAREGRLFGRQPAAEAERKRETETPRHWPRSRPCLSVYEYEYLTSGLAPKTKLGGWNLGSSRSPSVG